jgi:hypothetical protein
MLVLIKDVPIFYSKRWECKTCSSQTERVISRRPFTTKWDVRIAAASCNSGIELGWSKRHHIIIWGSSRAELVSQFQFSLRLKLNSNIPLRTYILMLWNEWGQFNQNADLMIGLCFWKVQNCSLRPHIKTGSGAHRASCLLETSIPFQLVMRPGRVAYHSNIHIITRSRKSG